MPDIILGQNLYQSSRDTRLQQNIKRWSARITTEGAATESTAEDPSWSAILLAVRCLVMELLKPEHCPRPMGNPSPFDYDGLPDLAE